jgi:hypothetical protein
MPWMRLEPRPQHALDRVVALEELGDATGVLAVRAHPNGQRLQPSQHEPGVERARHGAERLLQVKRRPQAHRHSSRRIR